MKRLGSLVIGLVLSAHVSFAADLFSPGFRLQDPTDPTKTATFDLSGLGTGTAPVFALPAGGGTLALVSMLPPAGPTPGVNGTVIVSNGTVFQNKMVPLCSDSGGQHLNFDTATNTFTCGTTNSYVPPAAPLASFSGQTAARVYTLRDANTSVVTRMASLTSTRVPVADTNGELSDSANLIFDTTGKLTIGGTGFLCFNVTSAGGCIFGGSANSVRVMNLAGTAWLPFSALSMRVASTGQVTFSNSTNPETTPDTGLTRAAVGVLKVTNGSTAQGWIQNTAGVTGNAGDWTNATTTLSNLNGLTRDLLAGRSYTFRVVLYTSDPDSTEGIKFDFGGGTVTASNFRVHCTAYDTIMGLELSVQVASFTSLVSASTMNGASLIECSGSIEPATAGTLIPRAAQNVHNAGVLTIARGSHLLIEDVPLQVAYGLQLLAIGDSKTLGETCCLAINGYRNTLVTNLAATGNWPSVGFIGALGQSGGTTATVNSLVPAFLATQTLQPQWALVNLGSNDVPKIHDGTLTSTAWLASMGTLLDAVHSRWPSTQVRLMRVYHTTYPTECNTIATWMDTVVASRSTWAAVGPDERFFLPGHVSDVTHPDSSGYSLTAAAWQTTMGY